MKKILFAVLTALIAFTSVNAKTSLTVGPEQLPNPSNFEVATLSSFDLDQVQDLVGHGWTGVAPNPLAAAVDGEMTLRQALETLTDGLITYSEMYMGTFSMIILLDGGTLGDVRYVTFNISDIEQTTVGVTAEKAEEFGLFPNPVIDGQTTITGLQPGDIVTIVDGASRVVKEFQSTSNQERIDISGLPAGIYFLRKNEDRNLREKLVIQ